MLIELLIGLIVLGIIWYIITLLPFPAPFDLIIKLVFALIAIFWLLGVIGVGPGVDIR